MSFAALVWTVFWIIGLCYHGWGISDPTRRFWAGGGLLGWLLLGYLGYVVLQVHK